MATVLFTDLVGSTDLMTRLGDKAYDELRDEHFARLREVMAARGGDEVKNTGDGLLVVFPSAVEALAAAVATQEATDDHGHVAGEPLAVRVGLSVGEVAFAADGDVFGTPVVEAARLVAAARPSQILCTTLVRAIAGSRTAVEFGDAGELALKGLPDPVSACTVTWEPRRSVRKGTVPLPSLLAGGGRIFVGRESELARLRQWWKETDTGGGKLVLLGGEPGAGKTRLAVQLAGTVHGAGGVVLAGRCDEDLGVPFQPFVEALRHYVTSVAEPRLGRHAGELVRLLPELTELVAGLDEPLRSDPETERYRLFDAEAAWMGAVSAEGPVLLVVDDVQWAAKPTLLLLRHVVRSSEPLRLLVVATYRDSDIGRGTPLAELLADVPRLSGAQRLVLRGLDVPAITALLEQAAGHELGEVGRDVAQVVWRETEGNAYFVTEVTRHLTETGAFELVDGRWVLRAAPDQLGIPDGVRDVVGRRVSRLSADTNRVLVAAAVIGLEFDLAVVTRAGGFTEDTVIAAVEDGVAARLVVEVPDASAPRARFAHALVRATLYDELSAARRVALHRRVAEAIEETFAGRLDDHLPALAQHWAVATPKTERPVDYARRAGDRALAQLAHDEAATWYHQAIQLLDAAQGPADEHSRMRLLMSLGEAQRAAGDSAYRQTLLAGADLARRLGDTNALARSAVANYRGLFAIFSGGYDAQRVDVLEAARTALPDTDSNVRARVLSVLALEQSYADDTAALATSEAAVAMARRLGNRASLAVALTSRMFVLSGPDHPRERLALAAEALTLEERPGPGRFYSTWVRYITAIQLGDTEEADVALADNEQLAEELGRPTLQRWVTSLRANRELIAGHLERSESLAVRAREIGVATGQRNSEEFFLGILFFIRFDQGRMDEIAETSFRLMGTMAPFVERRSHLAVLNLEIGRAAEARAVLEPAVDQLGELRRDMQWLRCTSQLAYVCARLGDQDRAAFLADQLAPYAGQVVATGVTWFGAVDHHLGSLAALAGRFNEAVAHFAAAEALHHRLGASTWLARTRLEWGGTLLRRADPGDAERAGMFLDQSRATAADLGLAWLERRLAEVAGAS
jgi:class 3 adenylate cyclase